jgi:hypothetical protein
MLEERPALSDVSKNPASAPPERSPDETSRLCAGRKFWRGRAAFATQGKALQASSTPSPVSFG